MQALLRASFDIIMRRFPSQSFLRKISLRDAILVYALLLILLVLESLFLPPFDTQEALTQFDVGLALIVDLLGLVSMTLIGMWIINRYAKTRFSLKDSFILQLLLTAGSRVIFAAAAVIGYFLGTEVGIIFSIFSIVFAIYMLLTFQAAISSIASITKSQAAHVILGPLVIILGAWLLFLAFIAGAAAIM